MMPISSNTKKPRYVGAFLMRQLYQVCVQDGALYTSTGVHNFTRVFKAKPHGAFSAPCGDVYSINWLGTETCLSTTRMIGPANWLALVA
jgi:hypothetical protein